ncbi:zinc finger HIT domain-containing protein 3 [Canna indica]|uniref:Zinc finger HIT domain-containing protein 3 n=1 Tax=Canna indica TaxID=4628 RepID=A0AAQ3KFE5_9LILI|nr:zinc finger HIT domain-containing protein 3 [Canna indica]
MGPRCPPRKCEVCCEAQSKYKCPNCFAPYCSLGCFKKHKENPCGKPVPLMEEQRNLIIPKRSYEVNEQSWVVDKEHLQLIANSSEIREALKDEDLRKTIQKIANVDDPENQLTEAMKKEHVFGDFAEKILSMVNQQ